MISDARISTNFAVRGSKKISIIYKLLDLKRKFKEDTVILTKTKTPTLKVQLKQNPRKFFEPLKFCFQLKIENIFKI